MMTKYTRHGGIISEYIVCQYLNILFMKCIPSNSNNLSNKQINIDLYRIL